MALTFSALYGTARYGQSYYGRLLSELEGNAYVYVLIREVDYKFTSNKLTPINLTSDKATKNDFTADKEPDYDLTSDEQTTNNFTADKEPNYDLTSDKLA